MKSTNYTLWFISYKSKQNCEICHGDKGKTWDPTININSHTSIHFWKYIILPSYSVRLTKFINPERTFCHFLKQLDVRKFTFRLPKRLSIRRVSQLNRFSVIIWIRSIKLWSTYNIHIYEVISNLSQWQMTFRFCILPCGSSTRTSGAKDITNEHYFIRSIIKSSPVSKKLQLQSSKMFDMPLSLRREKQISYISIIHTPHEQSVSFICS